MADKRLLETGDFRLLETGDKRLLEDAPVGTAVRLTQKLEELWIGENSSSRLTQKLIEVWYTLTLNNRLTQKLIEVWIGNRAKVRLTQKVIEVWYESSLPGQGIYYLKKDLSHDTLYVSVTPTITEDVKIP